MATKATTTNGRMSKRMGPTKRRGPRYRLPEPRASVPYRGPLDEELQAKLGLSADRVHQLRYQWPKEIARAIRIMRERGDTDAVASILAHIDAACAGMTASDERTAFLREAALEGDARVAAEAYLLDRSDANRRRLLQLSAREKLAQDERDALLRRQQVDR